MDSEWWDFSGEEYAVRYQRAQSAMRERGLGGLLITHVDNLYYLTGYRSWLRISQHRPFLAVVSANREPTLILPGLEGGNAALKSWVDDVRTWQTPAECLQLCVAALGEHGLLTSTVGVEMGEDQWLGMPLELWATLSTLVPGIQFMSATPMWWSLRRVKSPAEIHYLREACRCADAGVASGFASLRPGVTELEVSRAIGQGMLQAGAEGVAFLIVKSGTGVTNAGNKYATAKTIAPGEIVTFDVGCTVGGYGSDMIRSGCYGSPSDIIVEKQRLAREMADACLAEVRAGALISAVDDARVRFLNDHDLGVPAYGGVGHSIGISVHELPRIGPGIDEALEEQMTINVEPSVRLSAAGGVAVEDTVVVTATGYEFLTQADRGLWRM